MNYPFDTSELAGLDSSGSLSTVIQLRGLMRGIQIENRTPAFWQVVDDSGTVWFKIPPWSITQGRFPESQQVVIETEPNSPLFSLSTVTDSEYRLGYELFREALPYQVMNLVTGLVQLMGSLALLPQKEIVIFSGGSQQIAAGGTYTSASYNLLGYRKCQGVVRVTGTSPNYELILNIASTDNSLPQYEQPNSGAGQTGNTTVTGLSSAVSGNVYIQVVNGNTTDTLTITDLAILVN